MRFSLRTAVSPDRSFLENLVERSATVLQKDFYSKQQIQAALGPVFGVDEQMIVDGTYFVAESHDRIVGCGGWSYREALYGGRKTGGDVPRSLDPEEESARVHAFFVDPNFARQGVGSAIMRACEKSIQLSGFKSAEISATLTGEALYRSFGFTSIERYLIPLKGAPSKQVVKMVKTYT